MHLQKFIEFRMHSLLHVKYHLASMQKRHWDPSTDASKLGVATQHRP